MCKRDRPLEENVKGAETLAYLVEADPELQVTASITDHLINVLANYLNYKDVKKVSSCDQKEVDWGSEMKRAAFLAFASISANDEDIRDKVIKKEGMVEQILTSMNSTNQGEVAASLRCLQSLTRSVQQIRTVLNDKAVWKPLIQMLHSNNREVMVLAMTCLCNLALEFSPSKDALLQNNALEFLSQYSNSLDSTVRLNAVWAIMSLTYCASEPLRVKIITSLGTDTLLKIIEDPIMLIRQKALCIVRNILTSLHDCEERDILLQRVTADRCTSDRTVVDRMVKLLGGEVIEAVFRTIRDPTLPVFVLEQALCVLSNMADGPSCKEHIIGKTEELQSVIKYLEKETYCDHQPVTSLQLPVLQFITNIIDISEDAASQRLMILKNMGVQHVLEELSYKKDIQKSVNEILKLFMQPYLS
uniref:Armadillo repeat-containing protein 8 n=1 Tax=Arion vulgaris TaxID=1028688 RepID=A0A0B7A368_9EUPU